MADVPKSSTRLLLNGTMRYLSMGVGYIMELHVIADYQLDVEHRKARTMNEQRP